MLSDKIPNAKVTLSITSLNSTGYPLIAYSYISLFTRWERIWQNSFNHKSYIIYWIQTYLQKMNGKQFIVIYWKHEITLHS